MQESHPEYTLDKIIFEIDKPKKKHTNPTGYRLINMVGYLFAEIEQSCQDGGWVSCFQDLLIDHVIDQSIERGCGKNFLENLTIVSLNYDRSFEHFISANFYNKLIEKETYKPTGGLRFSKNLSTINQLRILKPHGYICQLKNNNDPSLVRVHPDLICRDMFTRGFRHPGTNIFASYGNADLMKKDYVERMGRHMYMVDERDEDDYRIANGHIANAELVFCLGLSPEGMSQSFFNFENNQDVLLNNKTTDISDIHSKAANFRSLGGESRLEATDFPKMFGKHVLE